MATAILRFEHRLSGDVGRGVKLCCVPDDLSEDNYRNLLRNANYRWGVDAGAVCVDMNSADVIAVLRQARESLIKS